MAIITSTAFAGFNAPLPEFKTPKELTEWRAELAAKSEPTAKTTAEKIVFYTGKPYLASTVSYAFKYRSEVSEISGPQGKQIRSYESEVQEKIHAGI